MATIGNILRPLRRLWRWGRTAGAGDGADRRLAPRTTHGGSLVLCPWSGPAPRASVPVVVRDFSATGLGVVPTRPLDPSLHYALWLAPDDGAADGGGERDAGPGDDGGAAAPGVAVCRVVRCWPDESGAFAAGLEFVGPVPFPLLRRALGVDGGEQTAAKSSDPGAARSRGAAGAGSR